MNLKNKIFLVLFSFFIANFANASLCTNVYYPVCAQDWITYKNSCYLKEAWAKLDYFWSCEFKEAPKEDLTEKSTVSEADARITLFLDNLFVKHKMSLEWKINYINKLIPQVEDLKWPTKQQKIEVKNGLINYKNKLVLIKNKQEEEKEKLKKEQQEAIQKEKDLAKKLEEENKNTTVIIAEDDKKTDNNSNDTKNEDEDKNKYITENTAEKVNLLRINYIKDKIWTRALWWARITAFNIVWKTEDNNSWITDNYTIVVSQEFYEDNSGEIHTWVETIMPVLIQSKTENNTYEITGHKAPRWGNLYESDINEIFPTDFAKKLQKEADFFFEKVQELKEINLKNARIYFENN